MAEIKIQKLEDNRKIKMPEKVVLDFLSYIEEVTQIRFDMPSLLGISGWVTTRVDDNGITICMSGEFYTIMIRNYNLVMKIRHCPSENYNKIHYIELLINKENQDIENVKAFYSMIKEAIPDMLVYIGHLPFPDTE